MILKDLWHQVLREKGITQAVLDDAEQFADKGSPLGAHIIRMDIPDEAIPHFRKMFEEMAEQFLFKHIRNRQ